MGRFLLGRLIAVIPVLVLVTAGVFLLIHLTPGDPIDAMMAESVDAGVKAELSRQLGLDQPIHVQYVRWMGRLLRGDLGRSIRNGQPVVEDVGRRLRPSLELALLAMLIALAGGLPARHALRGAPEHPGRTARARRSPSSGSACRTSSSPCS